MYLQYHILYFWCSWPQKTKQQPKLCFFNMSFYTDTVFRANIPQRILKGTTADQNSSMSAGTRYRKYSKNSLILLCLIMTEIKLYQIYVGGFYLSMILMIRGRTSPLSKNASKVPLLPLFSKGESWDRNELNLSYQSRLTKKVWTLLMILCRQLQKA